MRWFALIALQMAAVPVAAQDTVFFRSPTGNIACMITNDGYAEARCDLRDFSPSFRRPSGCDLDWGHAFAVGPAGPGMPLCAGDTVAMPGAPVLNYGGSVSLGGFTCASERSGMTCVNLQGHGFSVARARQRVF